LVQYTLPPGYEAVARRLQASLEETNQHDDLQAAVSEKFITLQERGVGAAVVSSSPARGRL
jgi:hypothetical protein